MSYTGIQSACLGAVIGLALAAGSAWAQADYPSGAGIRAQQDGYFDLMPGQNQPIARTGRPEVYRVCIIGKRSKVVADGTVFDLDHGDCIDVEASDLTVQSDDGEGETEGTYRRLRRRGPPNQ